MGCIKKPDKVKLIIGIIYKNYDILEFTRRKITKKFGKVDIKSPVFDFIYTRYYEEQMGCGLKKVFFSFFKLINPDKISDIKLYTNKIETKLSKNKKIRAVNLDPGYISESKLILATTKNYSHRIYQQKGIYAEIALVYRNNLYEDMPWTYPDYKTKAYKDFFLKARRVYRRQINKV